MNPLLRNFAIVAGVLAALLAWVWYESRPPEGTRWIAAGRAARVLERPLFARQDAVRIGEARWFHIEPGVASIREGDEVVIAERPDGYRMMCRVGRKRCAFILRECQRAVSQDLPANCRAQSLPVGREFFAHWFASWLPRP
jgi:hypothetical protein